MRHECEGCKRAGTQQQQHCLVKVLLHRQPAARAQVEHGLEQERKQRHRLE